jgi:cytochrome c oxidase cbb3-type subunit 3
MSTGWSIFVTVITIGMLAGCWLLLSITRRSEVDDGEHTLKDHDCDGITELENPLPRWWYHGFVATIVFGAGYLVLYPGLGNWEGTLGWTQVKQLEEQQQAAEERYAPLFNRYAETPIEELIREHKAMRMGQRIFGNFCSQCHGTAAQGYTGYPNLTDDAWIWGGSPDAIRTSIVNGRRAQMPSWQAALGDEGIAATTQYVLSLSDRASDPGAVEQGATHYRSMCIACHGPAGKGNPALGGPDLTDDAWLYGGSAEAIATSLREGRNGVMPAHGDLLDEARIHLVAAWVYSLSAEDAANETSLPVPSGGQ